MAAGSWLQSGRLSMQHGTWPGAAQAAPDIFTFDSAFVMFESLRIDTDLRCWARDLDLSVRDRRGQRHALELSQ